MYGTTAFLMNRLTAYTDLCIGYNSLSDTRADWEYRKTQNSEDDSESTEHVRDKPKGARTWTWLVLCDDGALIAKLLNSWTLINDFRHCHLNIREPFSRPPRRHS